MNRSIKKLIPNYRTIFMLTTGFFLTKTINRTIHQRNLQNIPLQEKQQIYHQLSQQQIQQMSQHWNNSIINNNNPMLVNLINIIRDLNTDSQKFRLYSDRIIRILLEQSLYLANNQSQTVRTSPCGKYSSLPDLNTSNLVAVSILRAGNSFINELLYLVPNIQIGQILIQRDETSDSKSPLLFYSKLPSQLETKKVFIVDPMIATGGTLRTAIKVLIDKGVQQNNITIVAVIGCKEGIDSVFQEYSDVNLVIGVVDPVINSSKYIVPGLGDFGDRYFATK